jgi:hypothetical protein
MPRIERQSNNPRLATLDRRANHRARTVKARVRGLQETTAEPPPSSRPSSRPDGDSENYRAVMKELGTKDPNFVDGLFAQLLSVSARDGGKFHSRELFFALAVIKASKPKDELEAMQVAQMAAVHEAMMRIAGEMARAEYQLQQETSMRAMNQLARTYTAQLDALKRYRSGLAQNSIRNVSETHARKPTLTSEARGPASSSRSEAGTGIARAILARTTL